MRIEFAKIGSVESIILEFKDSILTEVMIKLHNGYVKYDCLSDKLTIVEDKSTFAIPVGDVGNEVFDFIMEEIIYMLGSGVWEVKCFG